MKTNYLINKKADKTFVITLTLPQQVVEAEYQNTLRSIQTDFELKGFRKGKVPLTVVEEQISQPKVFEEVASHLISHQYSHVIEDEKLKPIISPQVKVLNPPLTLDKDWQIEVNGCELPDVSLDEKYKLEVKKINEADPKTAKKDSAQPSPEDKLDQILALLTANIKTEIPSILIDSDLENRLSQLVDQVNQAGITVDQYLKSKNQTLEQYRQQLKSQIEKEWQMNLAIDHIAKTEKIVVDQKEVEELSKTNPQFASNPNLVYYLLLQQKVFDYLKSL